MDFGLGHHPLLAPLYTYIQICWSSLWWSPKSTKALQFRPAQSTALVSSSHQPLQSEYLIVRNVGSSYPTSHSLGPPSQPLLIAMAKLLAQQSAQRAVSRVLQLGKLHWMHLHFYPTLSLLFVQHYTATFLANPFEFSPNKFCRRVCWTRKLQATNKTRKSRVSFWFL